MNKIVYLLYNYYKGDGKWEYKAFDSALFILSALPIFNVISVFLLLKLDLSIFTIFSFESDSDLEFIVNTMTYYAVVYLMMKIFIRESKIKAAAPTDDTIAFVKIIWVLYLMISFGIFFLSVYFKN